MKISWLGHACFLLEAEDGIKIITDPYDNSVGYDPINIEPDIVTVSHQHFDHNYTKGFHKAKVVAKEGRAAIGDIQIEGISTFHDKEGGASRGKNIIFIIALEGLHIAHFGDTGTLELDYSKLENIDLALVPVGGTFTIDAGEASQLLNKINPKISIPMHFKTAKLQFNIDGVEKFVENKEYEKRDILEITTANIGTFKKVVVLNHQR